jgi:hypothetical protein
MVAAGALRWGGVSLSLNLSTPAAGRGRDDRERPAPSPRRRARQSPANEAADVEPEVHDELYPAEERRGPIGADDPQPSPAGPDDETLRFEPEGEEERS